MRPIDPSAQLPGHLARASCLHLAILSLWPSASVAASGSATTRHRTAPATKLGTIMRIATLDTKLYRIRLPVELSDSTHGTITHFELITARLRDSDGAEGIGYTYTVGAGGAAVASLIEDGLRPVVIGAEADLIEALWHRMWWRLHFGGRGGSVSLAVSAVDIALWDLKAKRLGTPLWKLLGGFDAAVPCYAGGIDLDFPLDALLRQTNDNLAKGFRAIKMKVGRARLSEDA